MGSGEKNSQIWCYEKYLVHNLYLNYQKTWKDHFWKRGAWEKFQYQGRFQKGGDHFSGNSDPDLQNNNINNIQLMEGIYSQNYCE